MAGMSVVAAVLDGAGLSPPWRIGCWSSKRTADASHAEPLDELVEEFGNVQARFEELGGYAPTRERADLGGTRLRRRRVDADVGTLSGGWKMGRPRSHSPHEARRHAPRRTDQPPRHRIDLVARGVSQNYDGALLMTSHDRESEPHRRQDRDRRRRDVGVSGNYDFYVRQRALLDTQAESEFERQKAMLAKEEAFIARFKARASHAAQVQSRVKKLEKIERSSPEETKEAAVRLSDGAPIGRRRREPRRCRQGLARAAFTRARSSHSQGRALVRMGVNGQANPRCSSSWLANRSRTKSRLGRCERQDWLPRSKRWRSSIPPSRCGRRW